jgi:Rieske Fe-S protein
MAIVGARGTPKKGQNKKIGFAKESTCAHHLVPRPYHAQIWPRSLRPRKYLRAPSLVPHPKSPPHIGTQKSRQSKNFLLLLRLLCFCFCFSLFLYFLLFRSRFSAFSRARAPPAGWFCPCHGSHYDPSGRIMKGPAPENMEVRSTPECPFVLARSFEYPPEHQRVP